MKEPGVMARIDRTDPLRFIDKTVYPTVGDPSGLTADIPDPPDAGRTVSGRKRRLERDEFWLNR